MSELDLDIVRASIEKAQNLIEDLAVGVRQWKMTVPVDMDRDSDMILTTALTAARLLVAEVERLRDGRANLIQNAAVLADEVIYAHADSQPVVGECDRLRAAVRAHVDELVSLGHRMSGTGALRMATELQAILGGAS